MTKRCFVEQIPTPTPEQVRQWLGEFFGCVVTGQLSDSEMFLATKAANWGANQELEACCEWLNFYAAGAEATDLRAARRPKPKSLAKEALQAIAAIKASDGDYRQFEQDIDSICAALERLQELEGQQ